MTYKLVTLGETEVLLDYSDPYTQTVRVRVMNSLGYKEVFLTYDQLDDLTQALIQYLDEF